MIYEREFGIANTITFALIDFSGISFLQSGITFSAGDCKISLDSGTFANTSGVPVTVGRGIYSLNIGVTGMQAKFIDVIVIDSSTTKLWVDQHVKIETFGTSGQHAFNRNTGSITIQAQLKKNVAFNDFPFVMVNDDNGNPKAGLTVVTQRSISGAAFTNADATAADVGSGLYSCNFSAADLNGDSIAIKFEAVGAKTSIITILPNA